MKGKYQMLLLWLVALVCAGVALLLFEHELLWKVQEMNLWLGSAQFLQEKMVVPGGLLSWVSTWFTQFFYHPWMGVALLCAWWLLLMWLTKRTFRIPDHWGVLALVPVALLLVSIVDLGYWIYVLKLQGHCFVATIGLTAAVALVWAYRTLPEKALLRAAFIVVCAIAGYPLLGVYGLFAALLMGLSRKPWSVLCALVSVVTVVAVPLLFYRFVYYETSLARIYHVALPLFTITETHFVYYIPYILLGVFFVCMTLGLVQGSRFKVQGSRLKGQGSRLKGQGSKVQGSRFKGLGSLLREAAMLLLMGLAVYFAWFKDENFHHELVMEHAIERLDWQSVLSEAATQKDEPTRAIVVMRNIALARLGRQGSDMYQYRNGSKQIHAPFPMRMLMVAGPLMYYHYGMPNCCSRVCMEMGVEFGWNVEYFKYMARCAVLNGEEQLARKYLGILRQTLFFDGWVEDESKLVGQEELIRNDPEKAFITHMMCYDNHLSSDDGYVEKFVMRHLAESTHADDPIFQEQTLLASMWAHDLNLFWLRLGDYAKLHPNQPLPLHYQEAAMLYVSKEGLNPDHWPFDPSVRESYRLFNETAARFDDQEIGIVREALYPLFGRTYYYEYYLMGNLPQY